MCPHYSDQCDAKNTLLSNSYGSERTETAEIARAEYFTNAPYKVNLTDNENWKHLEINSNNGTVCSYKFQYPHSHTNIYQIRVKDYSNLLIGLYFYSNFWDQVIDYKMFRPQYCNHMRYCQFSGDEQIEGEGDTMFFSLDDSHFSTLNFLPADPSLPMRAKVSYRLLNKAEDQFVYETLLIIGVGVALILVFGCILHRAVTGSILNDDAAGRNPGR